MAGGVTGATGVASEESQKRGLRRGRDRLEEREEDLWRGAAYASPPLHI